MITDFWPLHVDKGFCYSKEAQRALLNFLQNVSILKNVIFGEERLKNQSKCFPSQASMAGLVTIMH